MTILRRVFVCEEHEEFGTLGWKPKWIPNADPYSGIAIPHDILEHFPRDDGGAECEFMALGGAVWLRAETGQFQRKGNINPPESHLAADLPDIMARVWAGLQTLRDPGRTTRLPDYSEDYVTGAVHESLQEFRDRHERVPTQEERRRIMGWMRKGYRRTARRYRNVDQWGLSYLFDQMADEADKKLKYAEQGQELRVLVDLKSLDCRMYVEYPEGLYVD